MIFSLQNFQIWLCLRYYIANIKFNQQTEFFDKQCQTEIGGINSANGEIGFEHDEHEFPYEAKRINIPIKRIKGNLRM